MFGLEFGRGNVRDWEAAGRSGFGVEDFGRLVELGIISPVDGERFGAGALRRAVMVRSLVDAGIPLDGLADAIRAGHISLDFLDAPTFERFSAYYGATVNTAARIADYARPGEVLVSQQVVDATAEGDVAYREVGPVELKGLAGAMHLHAAHLR